MVIAQTHGRRRRVRCHDVPACGRSGPGGLGAALAGDKTPDFNLLRSSPEIEISYFFNRLLHRRRRPSPAGLAAGAGGWWGLLNALPSVSTRLPFAGRFRGLVSSRAAHMRSLAVAVYHHSHCRAHRPCHAKSLVSSLVGGKNRRNAASGTAVSGALLPPPGQRRQHSPRSAKQRMEMSEWPIEFRGMLTNEVGRCAPADPFSFLVRAGGTPAPPPSPCLPLPKPGGTS